MKNGKDEESLLLTLHPLPLGHTCPCSKPKNKTYTLQARLRNIKFYASDRIKNNFTRKYYLNFYLNPQKKKDKKPLRLNSIRDINISINSSLLQGKYFIYKFCDNDKSRYCSFDDYIKQNDYGGRQGGRLCRPFDIRKGPANFYCASAD